jgi:hypothetical protein
MPYYELDTTVHERDVADFNREHRIADRARYGTQPTPSQQIEADRLGQVASDLRAESERIGAMCFSLQRCRERAAEYGYSDVVLAVQPLVDLYQDKLKIAKDAYKAADYESKLFDVRMAQ